MVHRYGLSRTVFVIIGDFSRKSQIFRTYAESISLGIILTALSLNKTKVMALQMVKKFDDHLDTILYRDGQTDRIGSAC